MEITEDKIRQIAEEARRQLGSEADILIVQKVVREVVRRLLSESIDAKKP